MSRTTGLQLVSQTLLETIPTFLLRGLVYISGKVGHSKRLPTTNHSTEVDVFDLVECGNMHRFMVSGERPLIVHNCSYGAGPGKIQQTLSMSNIHLSLEEVTSIHKMYWDLFKSVKKYNYKLQEEWKRNKGWVYNGLGRPMAVDELLVRDVMNRCLSGESLVLVQGKGLVRLDKVEESDLVWNGTQWCKHGGLVHQGAKDTLLLGGVRMTPDHKIYLKSGIKEEAKDVQRLCEIEKGVTPILSWGEIWRLGYHFLKLLAR